MMMKNSTSNKIDLKHFHQTEGNLCGPACIYMIREAMVKNNNNVDVTYGEFSMEKIGEKCGTDWKVGTPPDRMMKGFEELGIRYVHYKSTPKPYDLLRSAIDDNHIPVVRTITNGVPHWIIVNGYNGTSFDILDPWLGEIVYTEEKLDSVWSLREYEFFEVTLKTIFE